MSLLRINTYTQSSHTNKVGTMEIIENLDKLVEDTKKITQVQDEDVQRGEKEREKSAETFGEAGK